LSAPVPTTAVSAAPSVTTSIQPGSRFTSDDALEIGVRFATAAALIDENTARLGVAVVTADGDHYVGGDDGKFALASVVKLPVLIATLERAALEQRALTSDEHTLLKLMITASSNSATDVLWQSLGGAAGVAAFLEPLDITSIDFADDGQWGDSRASALVIAQLVELLIAEDSPLADELRLAGLDLMQSVVADQRWGASAGVDLSPSSGATLAIKNGWYPLVGGWLLNSAGAISVPDLDDDPSTHVVVVLSEGAATQSAGVQAIEEIAAAINHALVPPALAVTPRTPTFPVATPEADPTGNPAATATSSATPVPKPPVLRLVASTQSRDVLVPAEGRLVNTEDSTDLTLSYELPAAAAQEMLKTYAGSMGSLGWSEVSGPTTVILSKRAEDRWVALSAYPAGAGSMVVQVRISPAPGVRPAGVQP